MTIRRKKLSKLDKRRALEKERQRIAMKGGPTAKEKEKLRKAFRKLRRSNPTGDIRIGTSTFCGISAMVANAINNGLGGPFISIVCDNNTVIWKYGIKEFAKIQVGEYGKKLILKDNHRYIGEVEKKQGPFSEALHNRVVEALENSQKRRNPFSKKELIKEIRKHLTRKPPEPKRALEHLKELEAMIK